MRDSSQPATTSYSVATEGLGGGSQKSVIITEKDFNNVRKSVQSKQKVTSQVQNCSEAASVGLCGTKMEKSGKRG